MKINNHGQTLTMFVILLPLLIMLMAFVVDITYMHSEKEKLENTTKLIISRVYDKRFESNSINNIKELYKDNKISDNNVKIEVNENNLIIRNSYQIDSIFGKIIGIKKYKIKTSMRGYKENNKVKIVKE